MYALFTCTGFIRAPSLSTCLVPARVTQRARGGRLAATAPSQAAGVQEGAEVVGTVVWAGPKGAKILLANNDVGFMPSREAPFVIRDAGDDPLAHSNREGPCMPKGLVRTFRVLSVPPAQDGRPQPGPLLSARLCDLDVIWQRAAQLCDVSVQQKENLRVTVEAANSGGLVSRLNGLSVFVPISQLEKKGGHNEWWTEQDMAAEFAGQQLSLAVLEVVRANRKVVCSVVKAKENDDLRQIEVGALITGTVRRIESFGVFVGINNTRISGLLHISNVSRQHIDSVDGVFEVGEEVKCLIMGLDPSYTNISLSIAELEVDEGDVLNNKQKVWDHAEEQAALFRAHLEALREGGYDFDKGTEAS